MFNKVFKKKKRGGEEALKNVSTEDFYYKQNKSKSMGDLPSDPTLMCTTNESLKNFCLSEVASLYASTPELPAIGNNITEVQQSTATTATTPIYDRPIDLPEPTITYNIMPSVGTLRKNTEVEAEKLANADIEVKTKKQVETGGGYCYCIVNLSRNAILVPSDEVLLELNYPTREELNIPSSDKTLKQNNGVHMVSSWFDVQHRDGLFAYDPVKLDWPDVFVNTDWERDDNIWGISWKEQFSLFKFIPVIDLDGQFPEYNRFDLMPSDMDEQIMNMNDLLIEHDTKFVNRHVIDPRKCMDRSKRTMKPRNIRTDTYLIEIPKEISPEIIKKANKKCAKQHRRNTIIIQKRDKKREKKQRKHPNVKYLYID